MKLGERVEIKVGVEDMEASTSFYEKLGFRQEGEGTPVRIWDGRIHLALEEGATPGLRFLSANVEEKAGHLEDLGISFEKGEEFFHSYPAQDGGSKSSKSRAVLTASMIIQ